MKIDTILYNGNVHTLDARRPRAQAIAILQGRIVTAGMDQDLRERIRPGVQSINLEGRTVIPGLCDAHLHFVSAALAMQRVDLNNLSSLDEALARVAERAAKTPKGQWIVGRGWDWTEWRENREPVARDLDRVAPEHPVALSRTDGHSLWVNSLALQLASLTPEVADPEGGKIDRDETGAPTGLLREGPAMQFVGRIIPRPTRQEILAATKEGIAYAHRHGITAVHDMSGGDSFRDDLWAYQELRARGELNLRVLAYIPASSLEHALALGLRSGLGDEWLRIGGIKLFADGALSSQTAWMLRPFENSDGNYGIAVTPLPEMHQSVQRALDNGLSVAIHAIGDRANREMLDLFEELRPAERNLRCRIEHCQHLDVQDLPRFARLGIVCSVQPCHQPADMQKVERFLGMERARGTYAFRRLLQSGAVLAFGSDAPVEPMDMLPNIHAAVTRTQPDGTPPGGWMPQERLSVPEAVYGFTMGGAYASGEERLKGSLSPRKVADLVVLHEDIFTIDPKRIHEIQVDMTMVDGKVVYERK